MATASRIPSPDSKGKDQHHAAMFTAHGVGVVDGVAIGRAVVMGTTALEVPHYYITTGEIDSEVSRLQHAISEVQADLEAQKTRLPADAPRELEPLLTVHRLLLDDPMLIDDATQLIQNRRYNAEWAITTQGQQLIEQFNVIADPYLRERQADVRQVIERVLMVLTGNGAELTQNWPDIATDQDLIVIARDIAPGDMLRLRQSRFAAFVTDLGGATSHTAIIARSMGIPAIVGVGNVRRAVQDGDTIVVDGQAGVVVVNPAPHVLVEYTQKQQKYAAHRKRLEQLRDAPAETLDGIEITLETNIDLPDEAKIAYQAGAAGIGLFRSEFLFLGRTTLPSEEEQYQAYAQAVKDMLGKPVTIRTLDVGADKSLDADQAVATNPALGLRAIRYCLAHPDIFHVQLRALLRAAQHGPLRILLPMVTTMTEVTATQHALQQARESLLNEGVQLDQDVQLGAMVEVPAIALALEPFAEALDFLSIGTNDLIQYVLAVDRIDSDVAHLYDPLHPAVIRLLAQIINVADRYNTPVSMCGELAGQEELTPVLLGLGLTSFSVSINQLLTIKNKVMHSHSNDLRRRVAAAINRAQPVDLERLGEGQLYRQYASTKNKFK